MPPRDPHGAAPFERTDGRTMAKPRSERGAGTTRDLRQLADELDGLARRLGTSRRPDGYATCLAELAQTMRSLDSPYAEPWTQVDLFALFGNADLAASRGRRAFGRLLSAASSALIVLLVLCVPLEVTFAARAYGQMIRDPVQRQDAIGQGLPRLWEDGFGGHLPKLLDFTHVAGYALIIAGVLVLLTLVRAWRTQADLRAEAGLTARLVPALTQAQLALNQRRLDSPARFAGELSAAAHHLGKIVATASRLHEETTAIVGSTDSLIKSSTRTAKQVQASAAELGTSAQRLRSTGDQIEQSVLTLGGAVARLGDEIAGRIAVATDGLTEAGGDFATRISASGRQAAHDIGAIYQEAVGTAAADLEEKMTLVGEQLAIAVGDVKTAASSLGTSAERMTEAVSRLSQAIADSGVPWPAAPTAGTGPGAGGIPNGLPDRPGNRIDGTENSRTRGT
jgi:hypothetical protein